MRIEGNAKVAGGQKVERYGSARTSRLAWSRRNPDFSSGFRESRFERAAYHSTTTNDQTFCRHMLGGHPGSVLLLRHEARVR